MLADAQLVLGALVGGPGTITLGCLGGAQVDRFGNINSTHIVPRPFLVGSGGGNDVASTAAENVIVATLTPQRTVRDCSYITSPGTTVRALVTDLGTFEKRDGELALTAVAPGATFEQVQELCGWDLEAPAGSLPVLDDPTSEEVAALRRWDPNGWFLRA
jgi:acyl CoA:acetate/3-ketoacid CoA transferase beta subunit